MILGRVLRCCRPDFLPASCRVQIVSSDGADEKRMRRQGSNPPQTVSTAPWWTLNLDVLQDYCPRVWGVPNGREACSARQGIEVQGALEAIRGEKRLAQIAEEYAVHPQQVTQWKKEILENGPELFATRARSEKRLDAGREESIGHQQVVTSWFKKSSVSRIFPVKGHDRG